jgi:hypothetical protein
MFPVQFYGKLNLLTDVMFTTDVFVSQGVTCRPDGLVSLKAGTMMIRLRSFARPSRLNTFCRAMSASIPNSTQKLSYEVIPKSDFGPFKEYSVIHTDRSLNLMSDPFQRVMRDLNQLLKVTYNADKVVIVPG